MPDQGYATLTGRPAKLAKLGTAQVKVRIPAGALLRLPGPTSERVRVAVELLANEHGLLAETVGFTWEELLDGTFLVIVDGFKLALEPLVALDGTRPM